MLDSIPVKYGLTKQELMQYDGTNRMTSQLLKLLDADAEAAANPACLELLTLLMEKTKKTAVKYSLQTWNLLRRMPKGCRGIKFLYK